MWMRIEGAAAAAHQSPLLRAAKTGSAEIARLLVERFGVVKGDRVAIYMPVVPEAVIAMLAVFGREVFQKGALGIGVLYAARGLGATEVLGLKVAVRVD